MSLYSSPSRNYWRERKKSSEARGLVFIFLVSFSCLVLIVYLNLRLGSSPKDEAPLARRRLEATNGQIQECSEQFKKPQNDCLVICNDERNTLPRPSMHQSCIYGCLKGFIPSADMGCRGKSKEDMEEMMSLAEQDNCARYIEMRPKPEIYSTCKKYHQVAASRGFSAGRGLMESILNQENDKL